MNLELYNYTIFWICILGACLGSFFNVVILRSLSGESIVLPPSKCPKCGEKLKPWHNVPVLSYLFLRGKCAFCNAKISIQYPVVEILTMVLFVFSFIRFGFEWKTIFTMTIVSALIIMAMTDLREKLVDCNIAIGLAVVGFIYNIFITASFVDSLIGCIAGVVLMEILARLGYLFGKGRAFGEADTYVVGALGACFGLAGLLQILIYSLFVSMMFILPVFFIKQIKQNNKATCILLILFVLLALIYKMLIQNWYSFGALLTVGIVLINFILKGLKSDSELIYLPLVPALSIGTLYFLFF